MKAFVPSINWHQDNSPIYSVHYQPSHSGLNGRRLATAGSDNNVRLWLVEDVETASDRDNDKLDKLSVKPLATLSKHTQTVNVVRFDPRGSVLASAGNDGTIILWSLSDTSTTTTTTSGASAQPDTENKESWRPRNICRHSQSEIYDLAWSPDSQYILAGSMDNIARIYSASTGQCVRELAEHSNYVQGVAWDPFNEYLALQSSDRSVHIYNLRAKDGSLVLGNHPKIARTDLPAPPTPASDPESSTPATPTSSTGTSLGAMNPPPPKPLSSKSSVASSPRSSHNHHTLHHNHNHHNHNSKPSSKSSSRASSPSPSFIPLPAVRQLSFSTALGSAHGLPIPRTSHLHQNETFTSFFKRLAFSPDGTLLFTPSGVSKNPVGHASPAHTHHPPDPSSQDQVTNTVYIYTRVGLNKPPVAHLPGLKKPCSAVCCSPILYKLRDTQKQTLKASIELKKTNEPSVSQTQPSSSLSSSPAPIPTPTFSMAYRIVYAVITQDALTIYDTEQRQSIAIISSPKESAFTDVTWSPDGQNLFISSTDGFCSVVLFEPNELGSKYQGKVVPPVTGALSASGVPTPITNDGFAVPPPTQHSTTAFLSPRKRRASGELPPRTISSVFHSPSPSLPSSPSSSSTSTTTLTNLTNLNSTSINNNHNISQSPGYTSVPSTPGTSSFGASLAVPFSVSATSTPSPSPSLSSVGAASVNIPNEPLIPVISSMPPIATHGGSSSSLPPSDSESNA